MVESSTNLAQQAQIQRNANRKKQRLYLIVVALVIVAAVVATVIYFLSANKEKTTLKVGATPVPHAEILEVVKPLLDEEGIDLEIVVFQDFIQPNQQLQEGVLDANFYQYEPFLDNWNEENNGDLVSVTPVHIEPFGAFSSKYASLDEVENGATIAIPNDPVNAGRGLYLLEQEGLISLKNPGDLKSTTQDIALNPRNLNIIELEGAQLARSVDEVDVAFVFANYALDVGLDPKDAIFTDAGNPRYAEFLVVKEEDENNEDIQKLAKALNSDEVRSFIEDEYEGSIAVAF